MNLCPIVDELSCKANLEPWFTTCALTPAANHSSIHLFWLWPFFVFRALLEVIEEIEIEGRVILVAGIGCYKALWGKVGHDNWCS